MEAHLTIAHPDPVNLTLDPALLARPFPQTVFADQIRPEAQLMQAVSLEIAVLQVDISETLQIIVVPVVKLLSAHVLR